ncbi:MAG: hypothetical protein D6830_06785 [Ignavibacteria bacterium]|nr:MAG: hypothetical protein D6830_06785 [Ignavibacteria bacterium]
MKNLIIILLFINLKVIFAQACCTAGTPILGSLELSSGNEGVLDLNLTFENNRLNDVYEGSIKIDDNTRVRITNSILFEMNYGITDRITSTLLSTFVNQRRSITPAGGVKNELSSSGVGDVVLMVKYKVWKLDLFNRMEISLGGGIKLPVGDSQLKSNGLLIPADMQPGTGSWDSVFWIYFTKEFSGEFPLSVLGNLSYRNNSSNERFGEGTGGYKFGNELVVTTGLFYRTDSFADFSFLVRFRNTQRDKFNNSEIPNTGGDWINIVPGINFNIYINWIARLSSQIPVFRDLDGTQLTTSYTIGISLFHSINLN